MIDLIGRGLLETLLMVVGSTLAAYIIGIPLGLLLVVTDRDGIVAVAGAGKRELLGKNLSPQLEQIMEQRSIYQYRSGQERLPVSESTGQYAAAVAAPILCGGDVLGLVLFVSAEDRLPGEGEYKLAQAVAGFLGKHMEA